MRKISHVAFLIKIMFLFSFDCSIFQQIFKSVTQQKWWNQNKILFYQNVVLIFYLQIDLIM